MKHVLLALLTTLALFATSTLHATPAVEYKDYPPDNTGDSPTPVLCAAYRAQGQKCKRCHENVYPSGNTMNWVCVSVAQNYACKCDMGTETKSCQEKGECFYIG